MRDGRTTRPGDPRHSEFGGALITSLILVTTVSAFGVALIQMHMAQGRRQMQAVDRKRALYVAEAGLSEAFSALMAGKSGTVGKPSEPARYGDGVYWVEASEDAKARTTLKSTGLCGVGRFSVELVVQRKAHPAASLGMFGDLDLTVEETSVVDGYDSRDGTYASQVNADSSLGSTERGGFIASNYDVNINGGLGVIDPKTGELTEDTFVFGSASPGSTSTVTMDSTVLVTGATKPRFDRILKLPPVEVPTDVPDSGDLTYSGAGPLAVAAGEHRYEDLSLAGGGATITGPATLIVETLTLQSGAELIFDSTNGPITVYVSAQIDLQSGSLMSSVTEDPTGVGILIATDESLGRPEDAVNNIAAGGEFHGFLYAPDAYLTLLSSLRFFGAAIGHALEIEAGAWFSFDHALIANSVGNTSLPKLISWEIVDLPDVPLVKTRVDPLRTLAVASIVPIDSPDAHREKDITISYRDLTGTNQTYTGSEAAFDWTQVLRVHDKDWYLASEEPVPPIDTMP